MIKIEKLKKFLCAVLVLGIIAVGWWVKPIHFLKTTSAENVKTIYVSDGNTGERFEITDEDDIAYIIDNIKSHEFVKTGISLFCMGTLYDLRFHNENEKSVSEFIINSDNSIRKDPFFYQCEDSMNVIDYIKSIEQN